MIILNCASLHLPAFESNPASTDEILRGTKAAPLSVKSPDGNRARNLVSILDHSARFERLQIVPDDPHESKALVNLWANAGSAELPLLTSYRFYLDFEDGESLYPIVFPGRAPLLRTLGLQNSFTHFWYHKDASLVNLPGVFITRRDAQLVLSPRTVGLG